MERLPENPVGQTKVGGDPGRLGLGTVAAGGEQRVLGTVVGGHRALPGLAIGATHLQFRPPQPRHHLVEASGVEDAVASQLIRVSGTRVLRKIAELPSAGDGPSGRQALPRQNPGQRSLAGSVSPYQAHAIPGGDLEAHWGEQEARPRAYLHVFDLQHVREVYR